MICFTFIVEKGGGTYISQHFGQNLDDAVKDFSNYALASEHLTGDSEVTEFFLENLLDYVPISETTNVFCASCLDKNDDSWLINIVATVPLALDETQNDTD